MKAPVVGLALCLLVAGDGAMDASPTTLAGPTLTLTRAPLPRDAGADSRGPGTRLAAVAHAGTARACTPPRTRRPASRSRTAHPSRSRSGRAHSSRSTHSAHRSRGAHARRHRSGSGHVHRAPTRRAPRPVVTQAYIRMRARWHRPPSASERRAWLAMDRPPLVLRPVGGARAYTLAPNADGTFGPEALAIAREAFRDHDDGESTDPHPRVLELVYRAALHFHAPYVHLISGYRTTRETSRHNQGRAMDIVLPGVTEERLAGYLRDQGFVGVGTYPNSGFTHVDVRNRSYYWVDRSGPDQASQTTPVRSNEVAAHDAAARRRHETQVLDLVAHAAESDEERPPGSSADAVEAAADESTDDDSEAAPTDAETGAPAVGADGPDGADGADGADAAGAPREAALAPDAAPAVVPRARRTHRSPR